MSEIKEQTGQLIREARKAKGITQKELGRRMGVSESMINKYENGQQNPTVETLSKMISALGMTLKLSAH